MDKKLSDCPKCVKCGGRIVGTTRWEIDLPNGEWWYCSCITPTPEDDNMKMVCCTINVAHYKERLKKAIMQRDYEVAHDEADKILVELLKNLELDKIAALYEIGREGWWYA